MPRRWILAGLVGFATTSSARPSNPSPASEVGGAWVVTIAEADGTELDVKMTVRLSDCGPQATDCRVDAFSRAGAVHQILPWYKSLAGRVLRRLPPHGAFLRITGRLVGDRLDGELTSEFTRSYDVRAVVTRDRISGELRPRNSPNAPLGRIAGIRPTSDGPLRDYAGIGSRARDSAAAVIYDPHLVGTSVWNEVFDGFLADMRRAQDDLDAAVAFNSRSGRLPFSHTGFIRNPRIAAMSFAELVFGDTTIFPDTLVTLSFPGPGVAMLQVRRWERVTAVIDQAFRRIDSARADILILDFRWNPGGDFSAFAPLSHLLADSVALGFSMSRKWHAVHQQPPSSREPGTPIVTSDSTGESLIEALHSVGVVAATSTPRAPVFKGKVFLLINERAGSASEPPAEALRATGRATLIGRRTGGKMLLALPHRAGDGWIILFPEADYVAASGKPIEGIGVAPHIETRYPDEMFVVADSIQARSPLAAAVLRGFTSFNVGRWDDAERFYREAERLSPPGSNGAWSARVTIAMAQRQWDRAFALVDERARTDSGPGVSIMRARVATAAKRDLDRSIRELRAILSRQPAYSPATQAAGHKRLAQALLVNGDTASAVAELAASIKLEPRDAEALSTFARLRR